MDDLRRAQIELGQALDRARGGDAGLAEVVREHGLRCVQLLSSLLRLTRLHDLGNAAFDQPVREFAACLERLCAELGAIHIVAVESQTYVNDIRMRAQRSDDASAELGELLGAHNVGGISLYVPLSESQIRDVVAAFSVRAEGRYRRAALKMRLHAAGLDGVELSGVYLFKVDDDVVTDQSAAKMMARATEAAADVWDAVAANRVPNPLPIRRSVTEMLAEGLSAEGLWEERQDQHQPGRHSVRVARLALLLGQELGLSPASLQDLGVAAICHDVGYALDEGEHDLAGARVLLRQRGFHEAKVQRIRATLEHHRSLDHPAGEPGLFGRILRIVDDYDNLARSEVADYSPAVALELMVTKAGWYYDRTLLQLFINRVGCYPPGTLLRLADGRVVRSRSLVRDPDIFDRPECFLVEDENGHRPRISAIIDLAFEGEILGMARIARVVG
ncbi:MAG: HD domain-containing protein [Proteobacteria bacterium]|nr:HD domain-containing protein [Pseudomonadota bacterium]MCP4919954.1 HD domain-containing protein [Pseudomonadota bacterium]